jgi:energy-coupling factor transporter ATP-binding protein EcfA2
MPSGRWKSPPRAVTTCLLIGPPGTGKTMLASRLPGILPPLSNTEALETAAIASISAHGIGFATLGGTAVSRPAPYRLGVALVGGGGQPRPGEISLAHHGVLFLDELPEFDRRVLEVCASRWNQGAHHHLPRRPPSRFSRAVPIGGGNESLPLRLSGRQ